MNNPILVGEKISKRFGSLQVLKEFSLEIYDGEVLGLIGPNGAGKSTFINIVCGILKPDEGRVLFMGRDITGYEPHRVTRLGIVKTYQIPRVFNNLTLVENLLGASSWMGEQPAVLRKRCEEVLELVNLDVKKANLAAELSGGERKLLEFARAMMLKPRLLLLDEPFAGVNPRLKETLISALQKVNSEGVSILCVSHDMQEVRKLCRRIVFLTAGSKLVEGPPEEVLKNREVIKLYLGSKASAAG